MPTEDSHNTVRAVGPIGFCIGCLCCRHHVSAANVPEALGVCIAECTSYLVSWDLDSHPVLFWIGGGPGNRPYPQDVFLLLHSHLHTLDFDSIRCVLVLRQFIVTSCT